MAMYVDALTPHPLLPLCPLRGDGATPHVLLSRLLTSAISISLFPFSLRLIFGLPLLLLQPLLFPGSLCQCLLIHSHVCVLPTDVCSSLPSSSGVSLSMSPHSFSCMCPAHRRLLFATFILGCFFNPIFSLNPPSFPFQLTHFSNTTSSGLNVLNEINVNNKMFFERYASILFMNRNNRTWRTNLDISRHIQLRASS